MDTMDNCDQEKLLKNNLFRNHQSTLMAPANNRYNSGKNLFTLMREEKRTKTAQARGSQLQTLTWVKPGPPRKLLVPVSVSAVLAQLHLWSSLKRSPEQEATRTNWKAIPFSPSQALKINFDTQREGFVLYTKGIQQTNVTWVAEAILSKLLWL